MIKKYFFYIFLFPLWGIGGLFAQEKDKALPQANDEYAQKKFVEAEANYRVSKSKFPNRTVSSYNLGNAIYKQNYAGEAKYAYAKAIKNIKSKSQKHKVYHNLGNVFMKEKDYSNAVEAYKNALRNNPTDEETRYNLALAKKMLKENPPKNDKDKKKDKKDDKKKDDKDKNKKDDKGDKDKDKKDKGDQNKDKKDEKGNQDKGKNGDQPKDDGQPKQVPGGISKERLENLLDAVNNEEKKIQNKVNAQKVKGKPVQSEKNW